MDTLWKYFNQDLNDKSVWEELIKDKEYNPDKIGSYILTVLGYEVKHYLKGDVSVKDKDGKILYYSDLPSY